MFDSRPKPPALGILVVIAWSLAAPISAKAQQPWTTDVTYQVKAGQKAKFYFTANTALKQVEIKLEQGGQTVVTKTFKALRSGQRKTISFRPPNGKSEWSASAKAKIGTEVLTSTFTFEVISVGAFKVNLTKQGVDLVQGRLRVQSQGPLAKAELVGYDIKGDQLLDESIELGGSSGHVDIKFEPQNPENVRRLELKVYDSVGRWASFRLVAWYVEIPHDDVIFSSGDATIQAGESKKLEAVISLINSEVKAFRETLGRADVNFDLKLFVAGCTDTVGSSADNQRLSEKRARAIAGYFRKNGIKSPIFYEGYGENLLAVPTPDNTDEEKNRRAIYILTNTEPAGFSQPGRRWKPL